MRKKLHRKNQSSNFVRSSFRNSDNVRAPIQFRRESQPRILKDNFSTRTDQSTFTSIEPVLLDRSNKTSYASIEINKQLPVPVS